MFFSNAHVTTHSEKKKSKKLIKTRLDKIKVEQNEPISQNKNDCTRDHPSTYLTYLYNIHTDCLIQIPDIPLTQSSIMRWTLIL